MAAQADDGLNRRTVLAALLGASALPVAVAAERWRLASGYRDEVFHTLNLQGFVADVARGSGGGLQIEVHPGGRLAKLAEIRAQVEAGELPAGEVILTSLGADIPVAQADAVPFIVGSYQDARRLWQHQRPALERALAQRGLVALYAVPWPSQGLYTTRPVQSVADLQGSRMRTYNATTVRIAELLGAVAVDVPMAEVGRALAEGRIDSMITSGVTGVENQVWGQLKHFYDVKAWFPKNLVFANRARVEALPPAAKRALREAAAAAELRGWAASEAAAAASLRELARHGMRIDAPGFEFRQSLRRLGEKFSMEWVRAAGQQASDVLIPYYMGGSAPTALVAR